MITLLHGDEEFTRSEALRAIRQTYESEGLGDLNVTLLEGSVDLNTVRSHADAPPFLGTRRLVIVRNAWRSLNQQQTEAWLAYLPEVPETTHLVIEETTLLSETHPLVRRLQELAAEGRAEIRTFTLPPPRERRAFLLQWTRDRARSLGMEIDGPALARLVDILGTNLRLLHQELEKLRAYVGPNGLVTLEDVERLVPYTREASVFELVAAIGQRNARQAVRLLQNTLAAGQHPLQILALLARQYRIYIGLKDLDQQGVPPDEMASRLQIPPWTVRRDLAIARQLSWAYLESALERLLALDESIKQGRVEPVLGLQMTVLQLCASPSKD